MRLLPAALLAFLLAGCSATSVPVTAQPAVQVPTSTGVAGTAPATPVEVEVPRIGAKSSLVEVGLNADQTIEVPPVDQPMQAAWYRLGPKPGETGPAVLLGHVDGNKEPGIFYRLREVVENDQILVTDQAGRSRTFVVYRTAQVPKDTFPTDEVYGDTTGPELRVITCGGSFDTAANSYRDNTIVFAKLAL